MDRPASRPPDPETPSAGASRQSNPLRPAIIAMAVVATIGGLYLARPALAPVAIVLGLWFGGWLWGVAGVVLAVPVLVAAKSIAVELERTRGSPPPE